METSTCKNRNMAQTRYEELVVMAEAHDGLFTSRQARDEGIEGSVLARLVERGRLERTSRGVYRIPYMTPGRFSQHQEAVLWAKAHRGPEAVALSHETALLIYGISDANPSAIHITVPRGTRFRRAAPKGLLIHFADLAGDEVEVHEGIPITSVTRTVGDLLRAGARADLIDQAVLEARREGFAGDAEARRLRRLVKRHFGALDKT